MNDDMLQSVILLSAAAAHNEDHEQDKATNGSTIDPAPGSILFLAVIGDACLDLTR